MSTTATRIARIGAVPPAYSRNHPNDRNNHPPPEVADICGCGVAETLQISTLTSRAQLPSSVPAPLCARYCSAVLCCNRVIIHGHFDRLQKRSRLPQQKGALRRGACAHNRLLAVLRSVSSAGKSSCLLNSRLLVRVQCGAPFILSRRQAVRHGILAPTSVSSNLTDSATNFSKGGVRCVNVVFWLLVICLLVLIWFLLAFAFRGIGRFWFRLYDDAAKEIKRKD